MATTISHKTTASRD